MRRLPRLWEIRKNTLKKQSLRPVPQIPPPHPSRVLRKSNQRITTDSALQPFVTNYFTRLPWGNRRHVLPPGVVCDHCNNYFVHEVEKPLLDSSAVRFLRFHQALESKRRQAPSIPGLITPGFAAAVTRFPRYNFTSVLVSPEALSEIARSPVSHLFLDWSTAPASQVISRFMAKVALESMAARLVQFPDGLAYICDETQLDPLREHARRGRIKQWPVYARRIYDADAAIMLSDGTLQQVIHESDFLVTPLGEWYFVLALFGLEFAMNLGDPEVAGYEKWLSENDHASILYSAKNAHFSMPVRHPQTE